MKSIIDIADYVLYEILRDVLLGTCSNNCILCTRSNICCLEYDVYNNLLKVGEYH